MAYWRKFITISRSLTLIFFCFSVYYTLSAPSRRKRSKTNIQIFCVFSLESKKFVLILHRQTETMSYGVMVTQQILVLLFQVRILVAQLKPATFQGRRFFLFPPGPLPRQIRRQQAKEKQTAAGRHTRSAGGGVSRQSRPRRRGGYSPSPILSISACVSGLWPRKRT